MTMPRDLKLKSTQCPYFDRYDQKQQNCTLNICQISHILLQKQCSFSPGYDMIRIYTTRRQRMQKIFIGRRYKGSIVLPETKEAKAIFHRVKDAYAKKEPLTIGLLFRPNRLAQLKRYQKGGAREELLDLEMYIELGEILGFDTMDAQRLKSSIELTNDRAHTSFNIAKRLTLVNKKKKSKTTKRYLFWDIENFSNIASIFNDLIEPYEIPDEHIYLAANPDSLYLKKAEWEANLFDYGKSLHSFNFTKCDHGKNVADDVLLEQMQALHLKDSDIYVMTFDRELKERFLAVCHESNDLFIMKK